ncbi:hypothetical protein GC56T2_1935 [Geobacillus sp. C56-T2]|nr:hypothetical protein GC56T2_1935 [Geobacillus sp. C56-T2]
MRRLSPFFFGEWSAFAFPTDSCFFSMIFKETIHGQLFPLHSGMNITACRLAVFTKKIHGQWFALHPGMKIPLFFP